MAFCLIPKAVQNFKIALKKRELDPFKMADMTSADRRALIEKYVGKENAQQVNALYESKLLLKNQKAGFQTWAKKVAGISPEVRRDIFAKIDRLQTVLDPKSEETFLHDLASTRLNLDISLDEAKNLAQLTKRINETKVKITDTSAIRSKERLEYGLAKQLLKDYVGSLKEESRKIRFKERKIAYTKKVLWNTIPDLSQTLQTSFDNSIWGRQLVTVLFNPRYTKYWVKGFLNSWKDIGISLKGEDPILAVKADIMSRPNALNGKYAADPQGYGLGINSEETYSSNIIGKIPILKRLFKASEAAYNGGALRIRADIADLHIKAAESHGKNVLDRDFAAGLGNFVTSTTGRANIQGEGWARSILYAPRMYLADVHQLTAHLFDQQADAYVKKEAAKNLTLLLGTYSLFFTTAKMIDPDSVDYEKHLGQIKIGGAWVDFTGGRASFVNLAAKMSQKVSEYYQGDLPKYGEQTALDLLENFAENKFSPKAAVLKDILTGRMYGGEKVTIANEIKSRFIPLTKQDIDKILNDPKVTNSLLLAIVSSNGYSVTTERQQNKDWSENPTKEQQAFLNKVGKEKFNKANEEYNKLYNDWVARTNNNKDFQKLSDEDKQTAMTNAKSAYQKLVFKKYGFVYKQPKKTQADKNRQSTIKKLMPN